MSEIIDNPFNDEFYRWMKECVENGDSIVIYDGRRNEKTIIADIADFLSAKEVKGGRE